MAICAPLLLPRGTFTMRRGLPSVMLSRFFLPCAFFGTITYVPLMLTGERGFTLARAGTVLAVGSIGWSLGSWVQGRDRFAGSRRPARQPGRGVLGARACSGVVAVTHFDWWPWLTAGALAVAGLGMGLGTASLSVLALSLTPPADHGSASSSLQLSDVLGSVIGIAATGAVFAALHTRAGEDVPVFVTMWVGTALRRRPRRPRGATHPHLTAETSRLTPVRPARRMHVHPFSVRGSHPKRNALSRMGLEGRNDAPKANSACSRTAFRPPALSVVARSVCCMGTATGLSYAECVERLRAAREAAAALPSVVWQASGAELAEGMEALG